MTLSTSASLWEPVFSVKWKNNWAGEGAGWEEEDLTCMKRLVKHSSGRRQAASRDQGL